ncbi:hypothetical protein RUND412_010535 [Rhizina undulata]
MSNSFSTSGSSSSSDDSDHEYHSSLGRFPFPSQSTAGGSVSSLTTSAAYKSQAPEPSIGSSLTSPDQRPSRLLDVSNILNPTPHRSLENSQRTSLAQFGSPRSVSSVNQHGASRSKPPSPVNVSEPSDVATRSSGGFAARMSGVHQPPGLIRHASRPSLSGIVSAQDSPFPLGTPRRSTFGPETQTSIGPPQLPAPGPPPPQQQPTGFPFPNVSQQAPMQYAPGFPGTTPLSSANASPSQSYSSYAQPGQSPLSTNPSFGHNYSQLGGHGPQSLGSPYGLPGSATHIGHGGFPMMSLHNSIPVTVDTTAASKVADEKRKRNAGASARFRQRRKEREREMSTRISDLEERLKKAEEERDYYREMFLRMRSQIQQSQSSPSAMATMASNEQGFSGGYRPTGDGGRSGTALPSIGGPGGPLGGVERDNPGSGLAGRGGMSNGPPTMGIESNASMLRRESERYEQERHGGPRDR